MLLGTFIMLALSASGAHWLRPLIMKVIRRLMGLLLAALAVQFVINGLDEIGIIPAIGG
jgi:multiple antibiotic resistance protein